MPKLKLLILDANIVIFLHENDLWPQIVDRCELYLSRVVAEDEVRYYKGKEHDECIDLSEDISSSRVQVFDVTASQLAQFCNQFDAVYLGDLDPGEAESLAYLCREPRDFLISSADAIVFRILGNLGRGDQGLALEDILQRLGLSLASLPHQYTRAFREHYTGIGQQDMIQGRGRKIR